MITPSPSSWSDTRTHLNSVHSTTVHLNWRQVGLIRWFLCNTNHKSQECLVTRIGANHKENIRPFPWLLSLNLFNEGPTIHSHMSTGQNTKTRSKRCCFLWEPFWTWWNRNYVRGHTSAKKLHVLARHQLPFTRVDPLKPYHYAGSAQSPETTYLNSTLSLTVTQFLWSRWLAKN